MFDIKDYGPIVIHVTWGERGYPRSFTATLPWDATVDDWIETLDYMMAAQGYSAGCISKYNVDDGPEGGEGTE